MKTNNILTFLLISIFILASCRDNKMYFDEQSQSLVSLNDYNLRNLLFFNKTKNIYYSIELKENSSHKLCLKKIKYGEVFYEENDSLVSYENILQIFSPSCKFKIINFTEGDAAPCIIFLETDSVGYLREVKNENID